MAKSKSSLEAFSLNDSFETYPQKSSLDKPNPPQVTAQVHTGIREKKRMNIVLYADQIFKLKGLALLKQTDTSTLLRSLIDEYLKENNFDIE